jgi:hypothetical protein
MSTGKRAQRSNQFGIWIPFFFDAAASAGGETSFTTAMGWLGSAKLNVP